MEEAIDGTGGSMEWIRGVQIGRGSFSTVNLAIPKSNRRELMVVKSSEVSTAESLVNEREVLRRIGRCEEIVRCFGDETTAENGRRVFNLFFEYAAGGSLSDHLRRCSGRRLPELEVRRVTRSVLRGLLHVHESGFVHCDVKLQNILVFAGGEVKIADFGLAREKESDGGKRRRFELRGTPMYMSPEIVAGCDGGAAADVWALGCAVVEMATGSPAWRCDENCGVPELLCRIGAGDQSPAIPENLTEEGKDFLTKCFVKDPNERWTVRMLLDHAFVSGLTIEEKTPDTTSSPRGPFDFAESTPTSDSFSDAYYSREHGEEERAVILERVRELAGDQDLAPDWSVTEGWVTVR